MSSQGSKRGQFTAQTNVVGATGVSEKDTDRSRTSVEQFMVNPKVPPPGQQVIDTKTDNVNPANTGTLKKTRIKPPAGDNESVSKLPPATVVNANEYVRRNPFRRARENLFDRCQVCGNQISDNLLQCNGCNANYHLECVKMSSGPEGLIWWCTNCRTAVSASAKPQQLQQVSTKALSDPALHTVVEYPHQNPPPVVPSKGQPEILEPTVRQTRSKASISSRGASRRIELQLQKLEEEKKFHQQYLDQKYSLMLELETECSSQVLNENELGKIEDWIAATEGCWEELDSGVDAELTNERHMPDNARISSEHAARETHPQPSNVNELQRPPVENSAYVSRQNRPLPPGISNLNDIRAAINDVGLTGQIRSAYGHPDQHVRVASTTNHFFPRQGSTPMHRSVPVHHPTIYPQHLDPVGNDTVCILNRSQLAARQAVSRDLPEFSGNSEDWPLFLSVFNTSTQMCGFSPEENMLRLRKCLKDKALEAVRCRLLHPSNVDGVIATLKMLYRRPEAIIQSIIKKVRGLPAPNMEKLETVVNFALAVENLVATMQACQIGDFAYNASLRLELVERLPPTLKLDWAKCARNNPAPNLIDFSNWLYSTAEDASAVMVSPSSTTKPRSTKREGFLNHHSETDSETQCEQFSESAAESSSRYETTKSCIVCKGVCSSLTNCKRFTELSFDSKWATIKEHKLCRKCLRKHNGSCRLKQQCGMNGCTYLHHPLLHGSRHASGENVPQQDSSRVETTSINIHQGQSDFLFRIFPVTLHGPSTTIRTYAFVDDGSELTLVEQSLADELGLKGTNIPLCLKWTGDTCRTEKSSQRVGLQLSAAQNTDKTYHLQDVRTVESLKIRPQTLQASELQKRYSHLAGIPLESYHNISPGLLIGLDNATLGHVIKSREGGLNEPIVVKTRLGWTVYGCCSNDGKSIHHVNHHSVEACHCSINDDDLHSTMKQYFALDSLGVKTTSKELLSSEEQRARSLLQTLTIAKDGRYECGLLWKYENVRLPDSKIMALNRWRCLDRRIMRNPSLAKVLRLKIDDYVTKGYIRKLSDQELLVPRDRVCYLPMFPVWNPNKPDKTRLVWDAAAAAHGVSLNSVLLKGPDQLSSLLRILIKFREFKVAVCVDIREMYHQVLMREDDQHCLRFFWKQEESDSEPSIYVMMVQPFGACCSPSIAQHVKNHNAERFAQECPVAVQAITDCHYVDDMLISVETEEEAVQVSNDVREIHKQGGFEMHNWLSNSSLVIQTLQQPIAKEKDFSTSQDTTTEKVLGMWWDTNSDCFTYKLSSRHDSELLTGDRRPTKREVLRTLMLLFDPLGLIAHFTMLLKVLLHEIWRTSVGWDDAIEDTQLTKWLVWLHALPYVQDIRIPRCYRISLSLEKGVEIQLHTFMDASENGFAAAVYLRFQKDDAIECSLVGAKTRVAPLKFLSIPRSELQSCILGVRLSDTILQSLSVKINRQFYWTDSKDVLCWLNSDHRRYSQFVAYRVSEILMRSCARIY